jgi:hypothetical protein
MQTSIEIKKMLNESEKKLKEDYNQKLNHFKEQSQED